MKAIINRLRRRPATATCVALIARYGRYGLAAS